MAFAPDYDKGKIAAARIFKLLDRVPLISRHDDALSMVLRFLQRFLKM